jgi:rhodanese-related sulfurtransferase
VVLVASGGSFGPAVAAAVLLGVGTALVYPTLIAAVSDVVQPVERAQLVGVYRFWRDSGFVVGALLAGFVADAFGAGSAIAVVAALTAGSGAWVAATRWASTPSPRGERKTAAHLLAEAQHRIAPRFQPDEAQRASEQGALLVDLRSQDERRREGVIPGSIHVPRSVLEWRVDPESGYANPSLGLERQLILFCAHGYSSSLAAASLRQLGANLATDVVGGFDAWRAAGLPVRELTDDDEPALSELPGMGKPTPRDPDALSPNERGVMRAIECPCGHHLEGADDEQLIQLARQHVEEHHPEMERSDEQLRARIAADAYDVVAETS